METPLEKLKKDFYERKSEEEKSRKQDEVRLRVIGEPRVSYEQYCELVKGAHLEPIKKCSDGEKTLHYKKKVSYIDYDEK